MDLIKGYVINLVTTLVFMTAIELIAPDNSMKKYIKFVLGLILIAILINPIIKFATNGEGAVSQYAKKIEQDIASTTVSSSNINKNSGTKAAFVENFNKNLTVTLKETYSDYDFKVDLDGDVDVQNNKFTVASLEVGIKGNNNNILIIDDEKKNEIKSFIISKTGIDKEKIVIYYM